MLVFRTWLEFAGGRFRLLNLSSGMDFVTVGLLSLQVDPKDVLSAIALAAARFSADLNPSLKLLICLALLLPWRPCCEPPIVFEFTNV